MIDAIQPMTHFIRTAFGDSSVSYGSDPLLAPFMGLPQGNTAAIAGYTAFVSVIVEMMKSAGFGLNMWNALAYEAIKLVCLNFVDDTQLFHGGPTNYTSGANVFAQMQPMLNYWEAALCATGGALAHDKSYWSLIDFKWENGKWRYCDQSDTPSDLTLPCGPD
jgi:hypothetical protein